MTSPGSPDLHSSSRTTAITGRYAHRLTPAGPVPIDPNVGGRIQLKLGYESGTLQLIVTALCAQNLTIRPNGEGRNPYAKVKLIIKK